MKNYWTKKMCDEIIETHGKNTAFFGYEGEILEFHSFYNMLRYRMGFGEAETAVIIACIIKAGGKIK